MKVEFVASSVRSGENPAVQTGRLVNLFPEPVMTGGKGQYQLLSVLGMDVLVYLDRVFMRALVPFDGALLTVCGGMLSRVTTTGDLDDLGEVGESLETSMAENNGYATIVANGKFYTWDGTLTERDTNFDAGSVVTIGGYSVVTELNGRRFGWSDLLDPTDFPGLNFKTATIDDSNIIRAVKVKDTLILFKATGFEFWGVSGQAGADAFQRLSGAMEETGLAGYHLVTTFPNGMAFVGTDGRVHVWSGGLRPISTPPVEAALNLYGPQTVFYYERRGHGFICVNFTDCPAWCYDIATGAWHEREQDGGAWQARVCTKLGDDWYVGTYPGRVSRLTTRCKDHGNPLVRKAVSLPLAPGKPFIVSEIAVYPVTGKFTQDDVDYVLDDGTLTLSDDGLHLLGWPGAEKGPAEITLRTSRDGVTFGAPKVRSLGRQGQRNLWVNWRNLGQFRRMGAFEVALSSAYDIPLLSSAEVTIT